ncbi:hypothetical protein G9U51_02065 [Calidifontibacter sp. DB0510]|uniref:Uncharacterized protein n=1 Tax=Metallococcus carri TaxID=1656884 RepID=A0A967AY45_9MICO|nr:hypothetical protein [Metallococcus carri]NHN54564.1 hypothetical protein [Metallococcus carri]NOP36597.1 hypothetical protein [Calidifontibacter sp. DB2511S]
MVVTVVGLVVAVVIVWALMFAALGRTAMPARERLPLSEWTPRDLLHNIRFGWHHLADANESLQPDDDRHPHSTEKH